MKLQRDGSTLTLFPTTPAEAFALGRLLEDAKADGYDVSSIEEDDGERITVAIHVELKQRPGPKAGGKRKPAADASPASLAPHPEDGEPLADEPPSGDPGPTGKAGLFEGGSPTHATERL
jgi:hypothetical protein